MGVDIPSDVGVRQDGRLLSLSYATCSYLLPAVMLRVGSKSAELRHLRVHWDKLWQQKTSVKLRCVRPVGHYAIALLFDDGHDSGIYTWEYLWELCQLEKIS